MYNDNVMTKQHIFHHLGKAPYQLVDMTGGETACDYCGTYIRNLYLCKGSDGKQFILGSSCIEKLGDEGLVKQAKEAKKRKAHEAWVESNREWQEKEDARRAKERKATIALRRKSFKKALKTLEKTPHPNAYFASKGKTMLDYLNFFIDTDNLTDEHFIYNTRLLCAIRDAGGKI